MAKDHYVAQTYLRSFKIPGLKSDCVNAWRKSNLEKLTAIPINSICYKVDWSTNPHFPENPRIVEDFLKQIEPKWPTCVRQLSEDTYDTDTKYLIAGYLAYLRTYTPTAARLGTSHVSSMVGQLYKVIEHNEFNNPDSKHREAIEAVRKHGIKIDVDPSYPKALGLSGIERIQKVYANSPWIVFKNETGIPLITSDNPLGMYYHDAIHCDCYFPITPRLALIIHPLHESEPREPDTIGSLKCEGVRVFNQLTAQSAEDLVIFDDSQDVEKLVHDYHDWRVEALTKNIASLTIHQQRAKKYK